MFASRRSPLVIQKSLQFWDRGDVQNYICVHLTNGDLDMCGLVKLWPNAITNIQYYCLFVEYSTSCMYSQVQKSVDTFWSSF